MRLSFFALPFFYGWFSLAVAFVTMGIGVNARTAFSLLFPPILDEFGWARGLTAGAFLYLMVASQGVLGYGLASVFGAIPAELFQGKHYGTIFGTLSLASIVGGAIGPCSPARCTITPEATCSRSGSRSVPASSRRSQCGSRPRARCERLRGASLAMYKDCYFAISSSSTSNTSVAPGLITGGRP